MRKGNWVQTYTGLKVYPLDPRPEEICLEDIAHSLANICRFNGHCKEFYSVAQHSVLVSVYASDENAMWGLMHDASEAYLCDIAKPIKQFIPGYHAIETNMMKCIAEKYNLTWPMPKEIKDIDSRFLMAEARDLNMISDDWPKYAEPMETTIHPQLPDRAEQSFYDWYKVVKNKDRASCAQESPVEHYSNFARILRSVYLSRCRR